MNKMNLTVNSNRSNKLIHIFISFKLPITVALIAILCTACSTSSHKKYYVNLRMSPLIEEQGGKTKHGCFIQARRSDDAFEQHVRFEQGEYLTEQYGAAWIEYDANFVEINLHIVCEASDPYMFESTTKEHNVFTRILTTVKLSPTANYESDEKRSKLLDEWVRGGFTILLSNKETETISIETGEASVIPISNGRFFGQALGRYELLGLKSAAGYPFCSGALFFNFENIELVVNPQEPDSYESYLYMDAQFISPTQDKIYLRDWELSAEIEATTC